MTSLLLALLVSAAPASEPAQPTTLLAMEPLDLLGGNLSVTVEHSFGPGFTLLAGATAGAQMNAFSIGDVLSSELTCGGGLVLGGRWFARGSAPFGFWIGPKVWARASGGRTTGVNLGPVSSTSARLSGLGFSGQLLAGYTHALGLLVWKAGVRAKPYFRPPASSAVSGFFGWIYHSTFFELWAYAAGNP